MVHYRNDPGTDLGARLATVLFCNHGRIRHTAHQRRSHIYAEIKGRLTGNIVDYLLCMSKKEEQ